MRLFRDDQLVMAGEPRASRRRPTERRAQVTAAAPSCSVPRCPRPTTVLQVIVTDALASTKHAVVVAQAVSFEVGP